jgi:hypothetical protein
MEYCGDADLGAEMTRIGGDGGECFGGSAEQDRVDDGLWKAIAPAGAGRVKTT